MNVSMLLIQPPGCHNPINVVVVVVVNVCTARDTYVNQTLHSTDLQCRTVCHLFGAVVASAKPGMSKVVVKT